MFSTFRGGHLAERGGIEGGLTSWPGGWVGASHGISLGPELVKEAYHNVGVPDPDPISGLSLLFPNFCLGTCLRKLRFVAAGETEFSLGTRV